MALQWSERTDRVLGGDLTAVLGYLTPAGGVVVTAIAPMGLRDREKGELTVTTSLAFGKKLERIRRDPKVALLYHAREHGFHRGDELVLVQGTARVVEHPDPAYLRDEVFPAAAAFMGPPKQGRFWNFWLDAYFEERVPVHIDVERVVTWPSLDGSGEPEVEGPPPPAEAPAPQSAPRNGAGPRLDAARAARRAAALPHAVVGYKGADGYPVVLPVHVGAGGERGIALSSHVPLPPGGRRAGLLAHGYERHLTGLRVRQHTGWLDDGTYAPHTQAGFRAPKNKTLLLLANGLMAKIGLRKARKAAAQQAA